ncbi:hypothetical protein [Micromonospora sp. RTP1Z1]|uniref:hypothetical protein n=1 Tax=Micromonospora sp. RTP1Z1 TaxID=2994043 RepID=UPI0029C65C8F|nr:hypothetical protein [Micromonospora sp. RTP1Z1]
MAPQRARSALRALLVTPLAAALAAGSLTGPAAAASTPRITFSAISFSADQVDTTAGPGTVNLTWTVADTSSTATQVHGVTWLQRFVGTTPVGPELPVHYSLSTDATALVYATSGTARSSTYSYEFVVPQYGPAVAATWRVTRITGQDDKGTTGTISGKALAKYDADLAVTELADSTAPELDQFGRKGQQPDAVYDDGSGVKLHYALAATDPESGFWKADVVLAGPGGARVTTPVTLTYTGEYAPYCGPSQVWDINYYVFCEDVAAELPAGSPSGTWIVDKLVLADRAGNTRELTDVPESPIRVTRNDVLSGTDFALTPAEVDNWREERTLTLSVRPVGALGGVASLTAQAQGCFPATTTPTVAADGTASIPVRMLTTSGRCQITGLVLTDGAGNAAVYGSDYAAPALDLTATRVADTTGPVISSARLSQTTASASNLPYAIGVYVTVTDTTGAPVDGMSVTMYDAEGRSVSGGYGGVSPLPTGEYTGTIRTNGLAPGTYTVGVTLTDAAGNSTLIGYPNGAGNPAPNGPLVFTVTAD